MRQEMPAAVLVKCAGCFKDKRQHICRASFGCCGMDRFFRKKLAGSKIDLLKFRASYGLSGNDDIGNYTAQQTYVPQNLLGMQGLV